MSLFEQLRLARGFSRQALADAVGCSVFTIDQWDSGDRKPSARFYPELAQALGVPQLLMPKIFDKRNKGVALEMIIAA